MLHIEPDLCEDLDALHDAVSQALLPFARSLPAALVDTKGDVLEVLSTLRDPLKYHPWKPAVISAVPRRRDSDQPLAHPPVLLVPMVLPAYLMPRDWVALKAPMGSTLSATAHTFANEGLTLSEAVTAARLLCV